MFVDKKVSASLEVIGKCFFCTQRWWGDRTNMMRHIKMCVNTYTHTHIHTHTHTHMHTHMYTYTHTHTHTHTHIYTSTHTTTHCTHTAIHSQWHTQEEHETLWFRNSCGTLSFQTNFCKQERGFDSPRSFVLKQVFLSLSLSLCYCHFSFKWSFWLIFL